MWNDLIATCNIATMQQLKDLEVSMNNRNVCKREQQGDQT